MLENKTSYGVPIKPVEESLIRETKTATKNNLVGMFEGFVKYFNVIFTVVFLLAIIGLGYLLYSLAGNDFERIATLTSQNQNEFAIKQQKIEALKKIKTDYAEFGESIKKIVEALPAKADLPGIFIQQENLVVKNNLLLNSVDIASPESASEATARTAAAGLSKLSVTISVSGGDYFALKKYLADLENNLRIFDVKSIAYSPSENSYNIVLTTYYLTD
jgi:Tfp pilus assembly protein PilO